MDADQLKLFKIHEAASDPSVFSLHTLARVDDLLEDIANAQAESADDGTQGERSAILQTARELVQGLHDLPHRLLVLEREVYGQIERVRELSAYDLQQCEPEELDSILEEVYAVDLEVNELELERVKDQVDRTLRATPAAQLSLAQLLAMSLLLRLLPKYGQLLQLIDSLFHELAAVTYTADCDDDQAKDCDPTLEAVEEDDRHADSSDSGSGPDSPSPNVKPPPEDAPTAKPSPRRPPMTLAQHVNRIVTETVPNSAVVARSDVEETRPAPRAKGAFAHATGKGASPLSRNSWGSSLRKDDSPSQDAAGAWFSITLWDGSRKDIFCRVVGRQVMVRVGGGYQELTAYLRAWSSHHSPIARGPRIGQTASRAVLLEPSSSPTEDGDTVDAELLAAKRQWAAETTASAKEALQLRKRSSSHDLQRIRIDTTHQSRGTSHRPSPLHKHEKQRRPSTTPLANTAA